LVTNIFINSEPDLVVNLKTYIPVGSPAASNFIEFSPTGKSTIKNVGYGSAKDVIKCSFGMTGR
jgi:hypothetical protein